MIREQSDLDTEHWTALYNGAAGRATNSIVVIANGLNKSASLNRVGEFQRFSHNDILEGTNIFVC